MYSSSNPRRRHGAKFKAAVVAACNEPGASVAAVAQAQGLNANLVHQWRCGRGAGAVAAPAVAVEGSSIEATSGATAMPTFIPAEQVQLGFAVARGRREGLRTDRLKPSVMPGIRRISAFSPAS